MSLLQPVTLSDFFIDTPLILDGRTDEPTFEMEGMDEIDENRIKRKCTGKVMMLPNSFYSSLDLEL